MIRRVLRSLGPWGVIGLLLFEAAWAVQVYELVKLLTE